MSRLTPAQRVILAGLFLAVCASRLAALARTLFDWDEALFTLALREFDVAVHHPHPPGYPLFVGGAKLLHLAGAEEFRALQVVVLAGALALFPLLFALAREAGFDFATSVCAAMLFVFFPNVWVYGGTGFSDVPAVAVGLAACLLLLRGRTDPGAYLAGAAALGVAAGIRPTNLLIGIVPALLASRDRWRASPRVVVAGVLLGTSIVLAGYGVAAISSESPRAFAEAVRGQAEYVRDVDSWRGPARPALGRAAQVFWLHPVEHRASMVVVALLSIVSVVSALVRRTRGPLLVLALFAPLALFAWLWLDIGAAARYAMPYMAAHAILAADGLRVVSRGRLRFQAAACAAVVITMIVWSWPAVQLQRSRPSPPWAALDHLATRAPRTAALYVEAELTPQAETRLEARPFVLFRNREEIPLHATETWIVEKGLTAGAEHFAWPRNSLWKILRRRHFEVSVSVVPSIVRYGDGWYGEEGEGGAERWRWMASESKAWLAGTGARSRLSMRMAVPAGLPAGPPTVEVLLNSRIVDRFVAETAAWEKTWIVDSAAGENELTVRTSATVNPARPGAGGDSRELGLRLDALSWTRTP